jgi:hypothetical protein
VNEEPIYIFIVEKNSRPRVRLLLAALFCLRAAAAFLLSLCGYWPQ